jgi:hypothetical protein
MFNGSYQRKKKEKQIKITYVYKYLRAETPCEIYQFIYFFPFFFTPEKVFAKKRKKEEAKMM